VAVLQFKNSGERRSNIDLNAKRRIDTIECRNYWSAEQNSYSPVGENPTWGKASHHLRTEPHTQTGNRLM